jgi:hypothetical protein
MRPTSGLVSIVSGLLGLVLVTLSIVLLVVACQNLPGFLGPTPGDTSPRTPLGVVVLVLGALALGLAGFLARRHRTS